MENFRKMLIAGISILVFSFLAVNASAQGTATLIPQTKQIVLNEAQPFADSYEIDITAANLPTVEAAKIYFAKYAEKLYIDFSYDLRNKKAYMVLTQGMVADKNLTPAEWNNVLNAVNRQ
mgnify:CR=1 FL=1